MLLSANESNLWFFEYP